MDEVLLSTEIVAEVPVRYDRIEPLMFRLVIVNRDNIKSFWYAPPSVKEKIFKLFRKEGATFVMVDRVPKGADRTGWQRVLPKNESHLPWSGGQIDYYKDIEYMQLGSR